MNHAKIVQNTLLSLRELVERFAAEFFRADPDECGAVAKRFCSSQEVLFELSREGCPVCVRLALDVLAHSCDDPLELRKAFLCLVKELNAALHELAEPRPRGCSGLGEPRPALPSF